MSPARKRLQIDNDLDKQVIIPKSSNDIAAQSTAKSEVEKESKFYEEKRKTDLHDENLADRKSARVQREKYAGRVFVLVSVWITAIFLLLILQGFGANRGYTPLSDKVLLALITSTTVNLIGTLIIVLKYIFKSSK